METKPSAEAALRAELQDEALAQARPDALRASYLARMKRLLRLRRQHQHELNERGLRLLDHAIFAAYCDCREVGAEREARALLRRAHLTFQEPEEGPAPAEAPS